MIGWKYLCGASVCAIGALIFLALAADGVTNMQRQLRSLERREALARQRRLERAALAARRGRRVA